MKKSIRSAVTTILGMVLVLVAWQTLNSHFTERGRAWRAVHRVSDAVLEFREKEGRWPATLEELGRKDLLQHDGVAFDYDAKKQKIELPKMFGPTLVERAFTNKGGEGNYGKDLASVWSRKTAH